MVSKTVRLAMLILYPTEAARWLTKNGTRLWASINASLLTFSLFPLLANKLFGKFSGFPHGFSNVTNGMVFAYVVLNIVLVAGSVVLALEPKRNAVKFFSSMSLIGSAGFWFGVSAIYFAESPPLNVVSIAVIPLAIFNYIIGLDASDAARDATIAEIAQDLNYKEKK
nr:MAG TPA: hypothetical protein [Caudoviricetes sp.]